VAFEVLDPDIGIIAKHVNALESDMLPVRREPGPVEWFGILPEAHAIAATVDRFQATAEGNARLGECQHVW